MAEQPHECRLLQLPAELRNQIWELVLVQNQDRTPRDPSKPRARFCANVLQTCKQAHVEGTPILYGENTFLAHPSLLASLPSFLLAKRPGRVALPPVKHSRIASLIRKYYIVVRLDCDPRYTKTQVTESFSGVDELEVEVFQAMYGSCDFTVLKLFEGVRGVGKVVIQGSLGDGRYARWLEQCMMSPPGTVPRPYDGCAAGIPSWDAWVSTHKRVDYDPSLQRVTTLNARLVVSG